MKTVVWIKEPTILMKRNHISQIWATSSMSPEEKLNAVTRLIIVLSILGFLVTNNWRIVIVGAISIAVFVFLYNSKYESSEISKKYGIKHKEAFTNPSTYKKNKTQFTTPTKQNPVMNVLLPEIKYDPTRKSAAPAYNPVVEKEINDSTIDFVNSSLGGKDIDKRLFASLGDSFDFEVGAMNRFYSTPSTTVPNNQQEFADFCYGGMTSCKDGDSLACSKNHPRIGSVIN